MPRLPYVDLRDPDTETAMAVDAIRQHRAGEIPHLYHALLASPPVCEGWLALGTALRYRSILDGRLRELVTCYVAAAAQSSYEWAHHGGLALAAGVTEDQLASLPGWRQCPTFDDDTRDALAFTECLLAGERVSDELMERLRGSVGDRGVLELAALGSYYGAVARFLHTLDVEVEPTMAVPPVAEPWS